MVDIPGLEGKYAATKDGKIWSHKRKKFMTPTPIYSGYVRVRIRDFDPQCPLVHRLVAFTYIPNPENKSEVHHKNGIRNDNRVENLEWVTREENNQAAWDSGNKKFVWTEKFRDSVRENIKIAIAKRIANARG